MPRLPFRCMSSASSSSSSATPFPVSPADPDSEAKCGYDTPGTTFEDSLIKPEEQMADPTNRAFTYFIQGSAAVCYASVARAAVHKFVSYLSASADVLALASLEVDIGNIQEGQKQGAPWRTGKRECGVWQRIRRVIPASSLACSLLTLPFVCVPLVGWSPCRHVVHCEVAR